MDKRVHNARRLPMNRKNEFRRLFRESFQVDPRWTEWFMSEVYDDADVLMLEVDGRAVSTLLLSPYPFLMQGEELPAAYMSCVATARAERGKGLMHRLLPRALGEAAARGYALVSLIPSDRRLYFFYDRFGFSTVFYANEMRYTALHRFPSAPGYAEVEPTFELFARLEAGCTCGIRHDSTRFRQVVDDYRLSDGLVLSVADADGHAAMAFVQTGREARVVDLLADNEEASDAVLALVRERVGELPVVVMGFPVGGVGEFLASGTYGRTVNTLTARGMVRITDVAAVLTALAAARPDLRQVVRVRDPLIPANNDTFTICEGACDRTPHTRRTITLDVDIDVLARLLFSAPSVGQVFDIPTARPAMALMLD